MLKAIFFKETLETTIEMHVTRMNAIERRGLLKGLNRQSSIFEKLQNELLHQETGIS